MLHLLPQYQKDKVIKAYRMRLFVVCIGTITFLSIVFSVFMLPTYLLLLNKRTALQFEKESLTKVIESRGEVSAETNLDIWNASDALTPAVGSFVPSTYIDAVGSKIAGINIEGYVFVQTAPNQPVSVGVNGMSKTREALTDYVKELNAAFGGVKLPLASLAKQSDIPFDFKFQIDQNKINE